MKNSWYKQLWFEFRTGHSLYLVFFFSFGTFITVQYKLLLENVEFLEGIIPNLLVFILVLLAIYFPTAIIIGHVHLRKQIPVESIRLQQENPLTFEILKKSRDHYDIQYRIFEIGMFEQIVKEIMPNSDKKRELLEELSQWKKGWQKISEGGSTKEIMK